MMKLSTWLVFALSFHLSHVQAVELSPEGKFLQELVSISSGSADTKGVNTVQERIAAKLKALGFQVEMKANPKGEAKSGHQLVATLKGADPRFITLVGHADTVFEKLNPFQIMPDGNTAKGSGVSDNKGGLVVG